MALKAIYERFLASPNPLSLAEDSSLHYVPTLTSFAAPGPIIRHLETQNKSIVAVKSAKSIDAVVGDSSLAFEVDTTLEFISGGGAYLPGLENFITDKTATIPITHFVHFNQHQKIVQIRLSWDQASLLKQADVIGSRGRNWPVFDGKDQIRIISTGSKAAITARPTTPTSPRGRSNNENEYSARNPSPNKKHIKDPHASLDLFEPQKHDENRPLAVPNVVAPRSSAKPPPREMSDLFAAGHEDYELPAEGGGSPRKVVTHNYVAPKGAGTQKFQASRLFENDEDVKTPKIYKSNPARYDHFDLGEAIENDAFQHKRGVVTESAPVPMRAKVNKHNSQWAFEDFVTPAKLPVKIRENDVVHISWNDTDQNPNAQQDDAAAHKPRRDADVHFEFKDDGTPIDRHVVPKPRKDAQKHFEFNDEATPVSQRAIIGRTAAAKSLYRNVLEEGREDLPANDQGSAPLTAITNNASRKHDFSNHWSMNNSSPVGGKSNNENKRISGDHKKAVEMMEPHWGAYGQSPEQNRKPATKHMKKSLESHWDMGDEEVPAAKPSTRQAPKTIWDF